MSVCVQCGAAGADLYSPQGELVCRACHGAAEIAVQEWRGETGGESARTAVALDERMAEVRRCRHCGENAVVVLETTAHHVGLFALPAGRTYEHVCAKCGAEFESFTTFRLLRHLSTGVTALLGAVAAWGVNPSDPTAFAIGVSALLAVVGLYFAGRAVKSALELKRNPVVGQRV